MDQLVPSISSEEAAWKALTEQLPGILNVEFVVSSGVIREVHVLSDQSRTPKQIVRDIQSALLARFQLTLDHRIISVAQSPGRPGLDSRRLICDHLELSTGRTELQASVTLRLEDRLRTGVACSDLSASGRSRAIAQAAVEAINQFLASGCRFRVEEARQLPMNSQTAVLVGLRLETAGRPESLLGACYQGEDPNLSVALAALDAVNRRILALPFADGEAV